VRKMFEGSAVGSDEIGVSGDKSASAVGDVGSIVVSLQRQQRGGAGFVKWSSQSLSVGVTALIRR